MVSNEAFDDLKIIRLLHSQKRKENLNPEDSSFSILKDTIVIDNEVVLFEPREIVPEQLQMWLPVTFIEIPLYLKKVEFMSSEVPEYVFANYNRSMNLYMQRIEVFEKEQEKQETLSLLAAHVGRVAWTKEHQFQQEALCIDVLECYSEVQDTTIFYFTGTSPKLSYAIEGYLTYDDVLERPLRQACLQMIESLQIKKIRRVY